MNKLIVALIAGVFASVAAAQTAAPALTTKEKQNAVKADTRGNPDNPTGAAGTAVMQKETTAASKNVSKATTAEKNAAIKEVNKKMVNPDNSAGAGNVDTMQKETTAVSKAAPKAVKPDFKDPATQKALEKASTK